MGAGSRLACRRPNLPQRDEILDGIQVRQRSCDEDLPDRIGQRPDRAIALIVHRAQHCEDARMIGGAGRDRAQRSETSTRVCAGSIVACARLARNGAMDGARIRAVGREPRIGDRIGPPGLCEERRGLGRVVERRRRPATGAARASIA